jgi:hypothetical protein
MSILTLSQRFLKQSELNLVHYLANHSDDLFTHETVAWVLGFNPSALADILAAGLGPEPRPAFNADRFWFAHWQVGFFWHWLSEQASLQDCSDIASVMVRHDPKLGEPNGSYPREHVLVSLWETRKRNEYNEQFQLYLGI